MSFLSVAGVSKSFPGESSSWRKLLRPPARVQVLDNVAFTVEKGELFGILGVNGAGKSTLLHILATLSRPDSGDVTLDGSSVVLDPFLARRRTGYCTSADRSFYFRLTLRANLRFFGSLSGLTGNQLEQRISEVLELVGLQDAGDKLYAHCSSGMRQRASIARALIDDPPFLLLDEPTRAIDPLHTHAIRTLVREELVNARGKTVILATNILEEAWVLCDRVAVLQAGRVANVSEPSALADMDLHELFGEAVVQDA